MIRHETGDPILDPLKIVIGLGCTDGHAGHADRMDQHGSRRHNKGFVRRNRQRNTNRMAVPDDQRYRRLAERCDHLCQRQSRGNITALGIDEQKHALHFDAVLDPGESGQKMLILGGLAAGIQIFMAFDLSDDR